jgi:uncharacterized protein
MIIKKHQVGPLKKELYWGIGVLVILALIFGARLVSTPLSGGVTVISFIAFIVFVGLYILQINPTFLKVVGADARDFKKHIILYPIYIWIVTVVYALLTSQLSWPSFVGGLAYCLIPAIIMYTILEKSPKLFLIDAVVILLLWIPIEFGFVPNFNIPPTQSVLSVYHLVAIVLVIFLYFGVRQLPDVGLTFRLKGQDWRTAIQYFIFFMPIALVFGFATDFINLSDRVPGLGAMLSSFVAIAVFTAIPEEILFRGVIQNLLEKKLANKKNGLLIALSISSVLFGFAHGNNSNGPFIDLSFGALGTWHIPWVYIILGTVAGYFYGWTYIKTRKVTAAAVVHLLVDWFWVTFFNG